MHAIKKFSVKFGGLNIYYQNSRGLRTKTHSFYRNLCCSNYDIIVLTETWLNDSVLSRELFDDRYVVYRRDRQTSGFCSKKEGGGVLIAVRTGLNANRECNWESNCEDLWVTLEVPGSRSLFRIAVCAVYIPPPVHQHIIEHFINNCYKVVEVSEMDICLVGDFNLSKIDWHLSNKNHISKTLPSTAQMFLDFVNINRFNQENGIVNSSGRILDLVLTALPLCEVSKSSCSLSSVDNLHPPLDIHFSFKYEDKLRYNTLNTRQHFYKADYKHIREHLDRVDWPELFRGLVDIDAMLCVFYDELKSVIEKFVPRYKTKVKHFPVWFDSKLIKTLNEKNKVRQRFKIYKNPMDQLQLKVISKRCEKLASTSYKAYISKLEDGIADNPKLFWSHIKAKRGGTGTYPASMTDGITVAEVGSEVCELFAAYFASVYKTDTNSQCQNLESLQVLVSDSQSLTVPVVTHDDIINKLKTINRNKGAGPDGIPPIFIAECASSLVVPLHFIFNVSLKSGHFPSMWKIAKVVPVYKSGASDTISNYRPISLLSTFAKLFESLIAPYLQSHLKLYLSPHQHGFVNSRSTTTNLTTFTELLAKAMDMGRQTDVIYTDFSKAFDRVCHSILLRKLSHYGVTGSLLDWLKTYLRDRYFYVVVNGFKSSKSGIDSGVPQGSHIGPVLFNYFINDVPHCFLQSTPYMFADDLKFSRVIESSLDTILLQEDFNRLVHWCKNNNMSLNNSKCFKMTFSRNRNIIKSNYHIGNHIIDSVETTRDLGVVYDSKLTFIPHIDNVIKRASKMLGFVIRNAKIFRKVKTKILLYNSLVRSILEYCTVVWRPHYAVHSLRIERIQKRFLRHLAYFAQKSKECISYESGLKLFRMNSLCKRRELLDALFMHKLFQHKIDCPELLSQFKFRSPLRIPRKPIAPLCPPARRTVSGSNSPVPRLSKLVNSLSDSLDLNYDSQAIVYRTVLN